MTWTSSKKHPGIRWRLHPTRKWGAVPDRYFTIRFMHQGQRKEEPLGWASEGMTEARAAMELAKLKEAVRTGQGPARLSEKRAIAERERQAGAEAQEQAERDRLTFNQLFKVYLPVAQQSLKRDSWEPQERLHRLYIAPVIGSKQLADVSAFDLERIQKVMRDADKAPKTIAHAMATTRRVFNFARQRDLFHGDNPVSKVRLPRFDNRRMRFLEPQEAERLLAALQARSQQVYEVAMVSLHSGLRFSEIAGLCWADVDLRQGTLLVKDAKNSLTRVATMTPTLTRMFQGKEQGEPDQLVFPGRGGRRQAAPSRTFDRTVEDLGVNKGIGDPRQQIVFHSLRHSYAAGLVAAGVDIVVVKEMLGHKSLTMTLRYSHVGNAAIKDAANRLDKAMSTAL
ncbi:MAG: site-specific integrase [Chloroflexota bacterium]